MKRVCVFCGSSPGARPEYAEAARSFGEVLADRGIGLVYGGGDVGLMGIVADTQCTFYAEVKWPQRVEVAMRMDRIGNSSLTYGLAMFAEGAELANAACRYVHVYCDGKIRRPEPLPQFLIDAANTLVVAKG